MYLKVRYDGIPLEIRRIIAGVLVCLFAFTYLPAEDKPEPKDWKFKGFLGASLAETNVSRDWSGSAVDSTNWVAKLDSSAEKDWTKTNWLNKLKSELGRTRTENGSSETADLIYGNSIYSCKFAQAFSAYTALTVDTQHTELADPIIYDESLGVSWRIIDKPKHHLSVRSGAAAQQTHDPKDYNKDTKKWYSSTDDPSTSKIEEMRREFGGEFITNYDLLFGTDKKIVSEAKVFTAFNAGASLRWDTGLYFKLNKFLTLQLSYLAIYKYNEDIDPSWPKDIETKFSIMLGFSYNIF